MTHSCPECARDTRSSGRGNTGEGSIWRGSTATRRCERVEGLTSTVQITVAPPTRRRRIVRRRAMVDRRTARNDMVPFWIFDGPFKIERRLPMLPLSRESTRLDDLKQSLALYRLTFGQPRQEELLEFLKRHPPEGAEPSTMEQHIDLRPPITS
jgi:hypothetical protein